MGRGEMNDILIAFFLLALGEITLLYQWIGDEELWR